jgi:mono/diheme cytochrome c family protein
MKHRFLELKVMVGITIVALACAACHNSTAAAPTLKTSWDEPDLQGIWTDELQTPMQRPAKFAGREFLTEAEIAELDAQRAALPVRRNGASVTTRVTSRMRIEMSWTIREWSCT